MKFLGIKNKRGITMTYLKPPVNQKPLDRLAREIRQPENNDIIIRRAEKQDIPGIVKLLYQVEDVHRKGRPDLFRVGCRKYNDEELEKILCDDDRPVFVRVDSDGGVMGYAFCVFQYHHNDNVLTDITTLYIDDLCVDEKLRGQHIGKSLYNYVIKYAKEKGCYNVTLNVWECNESARKFYDSCGLKIQKTTMEKII